jgi:hypothetical protein
MGTTESAQQTVTTAQPQQEHEWLQKFVGEWTFESEMAEGAGDSQGKFTGTESVRSLRGLWILGEGRGQVTGGETTTNILTPGHDPQKQRYVGTWVSSDMAYLWVYDGWLEGSVLTLESEGPDFQDPAEMAKYRDVHEFVNDDLRVMSSQVLDENGEWQAFGTTTYRRRK